MDGAVLGVGGEDTRAEYGLVAVLEVVSDCAVRMCLSGGKGEIGRGGGKLRK